MGKIRRKDGSALIMALWVVGILSMLVTAFAFDAQIESRITSSYRKRRKADYLAISGIEIAEMLMNKSEEISKNNSDEEEDDPWYKQAKRLAEGSGITGFRHKLGDGVIILDIVSEPARRNVNILKQDDWEAMLDVGGIPEDTWPVLIDSVLDWTDKDNEERMDGAETEDYYSRLKPSYKARNGRMDTVEELLLIRGFSRKILYGGNINPSFDDEEPVMIRGFADLLTTYGDGKVNVNAASLDVLLTLPGMDMDMANGIIMEREGWVDDEGDSEANPFLNVNDLFARIPDMDMALKRYVTTSSKIYRITAIGEVSGVRREIWTIVRHSKKKLTYLRWTEGEGARVVRDIKKIETVKDVEN